MVHGLTAELLESEPPTSQSEAPLSQPDRALASGVQRCAAPVQPLPPLTFAAFPDLTASTVAEALTMAARAGRWDVLERLVALPDDWWARR